MNGSELATISDGSLSLGLNLAVLLRDSRTCFFSISSVGSTYCALSQTLDPHAFPQRSSPARGSPYDHVTSAPSKTDQPERLAISYCWSIARLKELLNGDCCLQPPGLRMNSALRLIRLRARLSGAYLRMYVLKCIHIRIKNVGFQKLLFATMRSASYEGCDFQKRHQDCRTGMITEEWREACNSMSCDLEVFLKPRFGLQMTFHEAC